MTHQLDTEKLAREAGIDLDPHGGIARAYPQHLAKFAKLVLEEAAKCAEHQADRFMQGSPLEGNKPYAAHECAAAIRALAEGVR